MKHLQKAKFALVPIVLIAFVLAASCTRDNDKEASTMRIGAILPLTGSASENGEFQNQGIDLALDEINAAGGIGGKKLEIEYGDSKNEAKEGLSLFTRFSDVAKMPVVICTMSGVSAPLASFVAGQKEHNSVLFATVASAPGLAKQSEWVFRSFITSDVEAARMAEYAFQDQGMRSMAVLYVNDDYGLGGFGVFKSEFESAGGRIVFAEPFEKGGSDFRTSILKMGAQSPQGVYIVGYDKSYATVIKQIGEVRTSVKMFTTASISVPSWLELAGSSANGMYLTASLFGTDRNDPMTAQFVQAYKQRFNREPNYVSAITYTITKLVAGAIGKVGTDPDAIRRELASVKDHQSLLGAITINQEREGSLPVTVMRIEDGRIVPAASN